MALHRAATRPAARPQLERAATKPGQAWAALRAALEEDAQNTSSEEAPARRLLRPPACRPASVFRERRYACHSYKTCCSTLPQLMVAQKQEAGSNSGHLASEDTCELRISLIQTGPLGPAGDR